MARQQLGQPSYYLLAVLVGIDVLGNAVLGGRQYQTMSCRIGESLMHHGWAEKIPWPRWFRAHCLASVFRAIV